MSIIKKIIFIIFTITFVAEVNAKEVKKMGTHKDWDTYVINSDTDKVCFAQSKPVLQAPKKSQRDARLFITFRPGEKITNEISITAGYEFNTKNSITATSGKNKYKFDIAQEGFAWITDNKIEKKMISSSIILHVHTHTRIRIRVKEWHNNLLRSLRSTRPSRKL